MPRLFRLHIMLLSYLIDLSGSPSRTVFRWNNDTNASVVTTLITNNRPSTIINDLRNHFNTSRPTGRCTEIADFLKNPYYPFYRLDDRRVCYNRIDLLSSVLVPHLSVGGRWDQEFDTPAANYSQVINRRPNSRVIDRRSDGRMIDRRSVGDAIDMRSDQPSRGEGDWHAARWQRWLTGDSKVDWQAIRSRGRMVSDLIKSDVAIERQGETQWCLPASRSISSVSVTQTLPDSRGARGLLDNIPVESAKITVVMAQRHYTMVG